MITYPRCSRRILSQKGQVVPALVSLIILVFVFTIFNVAKLPSPYVGILFIGLFVFGLAFVKPDLALVFLIFSMLFSPELSLGGIPGRAVVVRADDIFLFVIFLGWLAKMAVNKELGLLKLTSLNKPILVYVSIYVLATLIGDLRGFVSFKTGFFYLMKYMEYFLLYFMVTNNLDDMKQLRMFVFFMIFVCLAVSLYAWVQHFSGVERVTAPFEGKEGEANTLGGYLVLLMMVVMGLLLNTPSPVERFCLSVVMFFALPALSFTLSRGSWFGFIPAYATLFVLTKRGKLFLFFVFLASVFLSTVVFPGYVQRRVRTTFSTGKQYNVLGAKVTLDESASARVDSWKYGMRKWKEEPLIGRGAGSPVPVVDNQYVRTMIEVGIVGLWAFFFLFWRIYRSAMEGFRTLGEDRFSGGLIAGFIAGFIGLLFHCFSAETFILIRIMEPFWFLTAIVVMLPSLQPVAPEALGLDTT